MASNDTEGAFKESTEMEEQVRFEFSILTVHTILAEHPLVNETCHVYFCIDGGPCKTHDKLLFVRDARQTIEQSSTYLENFIIHVK